MPVTCPACGAPSLDREFCDRCNADLGCKEVLTSPCVFPADNGEVIPLGRFERARLGRPEAFAVVTGGDGRRWRVHWIPAAQWPLWEPFFTERQARKSPYLPECRVVEAETGRWVVAEATGTPPPLGLSGRGDAGPVHQVRRLAGVLDAFGEALGALHDAGLVWLTFDPEAVEIADGQLWFTNLDLRVEPAGRCPTELETLPAFAAPEVCRFQDEKIGPRTDVFHLTLFAYYWLASYLPCGFTGKGLEAFDFELPPLRVLAPWLPPGIAAVLHHGLDVEPERRFGSVAELCAAYREAVGRAERRWEAREAVHWEIGLHSRTGLGKSARGGVNEDYALVREFGHPQRALVLVADGVSSCEVGSGDVASRLVCELTAGMFGPHDRAADFRRKLPDACPEGAEALLQWALDRGEEDRLRRGAGLMATTLTGAWLEGGELTLANVGDSRAYLVDDAGAEQLTVDGDLGCALLGAGAPPEEVYGLEGLARALREYVGGCCRTPRGELAVDEDRCRPRLSRWPLVPGDVVVLCSDGLVEEGAFLEPAELGELVRGHPDLPAAALAEKLAEAAEARQRPPSEAEPEGFGDNITCAVIRIHRAAPAVGAGQVGFEDGPS
jgi:serine/threonine protein phosphatase PrpC